MNILVIGNGFDLAHGLPTQYTDFLKFINGLVYFDMKYGNVDCCEKDVLADKGEYSSLMSYYYTLLTDRKIYYEELLKMAKDNKWISYFNSIVEKRKIEEKIGWIDFESEISSIVQMLDESDIIIRQGLEEGKEDVHLEHRQLDVLAPFILEGKKINPHTYSVTSAFIPIKKKILLEDLDRLIRGLEIYLSDYICSLAIVKEYDMIKNLRIDRVDRKSVV